MSTNQWRLGKHGPSQQDLIGVEDLVPANALRDELDTVILDENSQIITAD